MSSKEIEEMVDILRKELENDGIQRIETDPRKRINDLLSKNEESLSMETDNDKKNALLKESEFLRHLLKNIENLRMEKIIRDALTDKRSENIMKREIIVYETLIKYIGEREEEEEKTLMMVREKIPAFIGFDGQENGPFEPGDIASIHIEDFKTLEKEGLVKRVEIEK